LSPPPKLTGEAPRPSAIPRENIALGSRLVGDRGAEPSELRVQLPIKFEPVINLKTAKALGLMVQLALRVPTR
jgi:hypothetical protein